MDRVGDTAPMGLHDTTDAQTEPARGGVGASALLVVLLLALVGATAACLAAAGIALGIGPAALVTAARRGVEPVQAAALAGLVLGPFLIAWLLGRSWSAFAAARSGRCADWMLAAIAASSGLHALVFGGW